MKFPKVCELGSIVAMNVRVPCKTHTLKYPLAYPFPSQYRSVPVLAVVLILVFSYPFDMIASYSDVFDNRCSLLLVVTNSFQKMFIIVTPSGAQIPAVSLSAYNAHPVSPSIVF